jgi:hypothetical protein
MTKPDSNIRVFGVRHHGPGSARSLLRAFEQWQPDAILIEGPPEAEELLSLVVHQEMKPPVALLVYVPDEPQRAVFYPFAVFSPEWQALHYCTSRGLAVRFIDLPQTHWLALREPRPDSQAAVPESPLDQLAQASGFEDGDRWWERLVEERQSDDDVFVAVLELMTALRTQMAAEPRAGQTLQTAEYQAWVDPLGPVREAAMRASIRTVQNEGFQRIAVICGAWHAPALFGTETTENTTQADAALLDGLPRVKVSATWVPWSYGHLSRASGYGAGITSPGWYEHLWTTPQDTTVRWLGQVARLLRDEDMDASAAQVIDAVRLADALAALRERAHPGLQELNEAALTTFCFGNPLPLAVIHEQLIVGERLGQVPADVPAVPLQQDLAATQKRLRLKPEASPRQVDLDLRKPTGLARSHLLHRLSLLGIPWGQMERVRGQRGTFHEIWTLQWEPAFAVAVIEKAVWGNTIADAAAAYARHTADEAPTLAILTALLEQILLADLKDAVDHVVGCLQAQTALTGDVAGLMEALPPLSRTVRYGSVRHDAKIGDLDVSEIGAVVDGLVARICIGLPLACSSLDDDAARSMLDRVEKVRASLGALQRPALSDRWQHTLQHLVDQHGLHGLLSGRCCRLLHDGGTLDSEDVARRLRLALSPANDPTQAAAWLEGLLRGSGLLLLHDETLWNILDGWVTELPAGTFDTVLPLLRRTFSAFPSPERRQMGERVRRGPAAPTTGGALAGDVDTDRANQALPLLARLLGLGME